MSVFSNFYYNYLYITDLLQLLDSQTCKETNRLENIHSHKSLQEIQGRAATTDYEMISGKLITNESRKDNWTQQSVADFHWRRMLDVSFIIKKKIFE